MAGGALLWWLGTNGWDLVGRRIVIVTLAGALVSGTLKPLIRRRRPGGDAKLFYLAFDRHSFPSGHATRVGGLVIVLGALAPVWGAVALVVWGLAVGLSRVALGVHFAGDIAAGLLLGLLVGIGLLVFLF